MSNMLKEVIVDAKALREAALKNAEATIVDKYSAEVRHTLDKLLEQDELDLDTEADLGLGEPALAEPAGETEEIAEDIPLAATDNFSELDGTGLSRLAAEGENVEVNINLDALQEAVEELASSVEENDEVVDEEIEFNEADLVAMLSEDDEEILDETQSAGVSSAAEEAADSAAMSNLLGEDDEDESEKEQEMVDSAEMASEGFEITDELIDDIAERLTVDMGATLSGWAGRSAYDLKWEMEKSMAHRRGTDAHEELEILKKAQEELVFENNRLNEHTNQYKEAVSGLETTLQEVNLSNARLLYTNRVLRNTSLNERQKDKIAEAISKAGSVTEAKTLYETLKSTVESRPKARQKSLSEMIHRPSSVIRASSQEVQPTDPFTERMKRLAGIK